jgi:uncharacterized protein (DUF885 family)
MTALPAAEQLRALADEYWEFHLETSPLLASYFGDHRFDDRADDLSAEGEQAIRSKLAEFFERVGQIPTDGLSDSDAVTRELLDGELRERMSMIDLRYIELASDQMQGAHSDLLQIAGLLKAPEPEHARMTVTRIGELARMLDQAAQRYR